MIGVRSALRSFRTDYSDPLAKAVPCALPDRIRRAPNARHPHNPDRNAIGSPRSELFCKPPDAGGANRCFIDLQDFCRLAGGSGTQVSQAPGRRLSQFLVLPGGDLEPGDHSMGRIRTRARLLAPQTVIGPVVIPLRRWLQELRFE